MFDVWIHFLLIRFRSCSLQSFVPAQNNAVLRGKISPAVITASKAANVKDAKLRFALLGQSFFFFDFLLFCFHCFFCVLGLYGPHLECRARASHLQAAEFKVLCCDRLLRTGSCELVLEGHNEAVCSILRFCSIFSNTKLPSQNSLLLFASAMYVVMRFSLHLSRLQIRTGGPVDRNEVDEVEEVELIRLSGGYLLRGQFRQAALSFFCINHVSGTSRTWTLGTLQIVCRNKTVKRCVMLEALVRRQWSMRSCAVSFSVLQELQVKSERIWNILRACII